MIVVKVRENSLTIDGHAGYAEFGKDIVCAAVSALTQSFIKSVETLTADKLKYKISSGNTVILHGDLSEKSQTLLDSFFIGICMIANEFPENVRIV